MTRIAWAVLALGSLFITHSPSEGREREHSLLPSQVGSGELVPLLEVQQRLLPRMRGHRYIGAEYDQEARIYRLKFIRDGQVVWVDVDARSGRVIGRALPQAAR